MGRVSRLPDETAVQIICSIIHMLLKLHLKHFINTEERKLALVHVATSFLTIQTLDRPISTLFYIILQRVIYLLAHLWLTLAGIMHPPQPPISYAHISTCLGFYIVVFVFSHACLVIK